MVCRYLLWQTFTHIEISIRCHHLMKEQTSSVPHPQADATPLRACVFLSALPTQALQGSLPATGIDRPSSVSSAGASGASDEERGSSSSIISMFVLSSLFNCFVFLTGHTVR